MKAALRDAGFTFDWWETDAPGHATELAANTPDVATVVVMGGDGTTHEAAKSIIGTNRTLGVVPMGSGDDFAYALGLARHDLKAAVEVLKTGRVRLVDTGVCNGEPFLNAAGVGFDAEVGAYVHQAPARFTGIAAYLWAVVAALRNLAPIRMKVWGTDPSGTEHLLHDDASLLVSLQNGPRTGGSFLFAPMADVDDGVLEAVIAAGVGRVGTLTLLPKALRGQHLGDARVTHAAVTSLRIESEHPRAWHTDGEVFPTASAFALTCNPKSLRVRAP